MSTSTVIRVAVPYTITYEDGGLYCNGKKTSMQYLRKPVKGPRGPLVALVDTRTIGANGKYDVVGLAEEECQTIVRLGHEYMEARQAEYARTHAAELAAENERNRREAEYDALYNEGRRTGYNPHR